MRLMSTHGSLDWPPKLAGLLNWPLNAFPPEHGALTKCSQSLRGGCRSPPLTRPGTGRAYDTGFNTGPPL